MVFAVPAGVVSLAALVALAVSGDAEAAAWMPPVEAPVARAFDLGPDPFEAGRHRGIDLAAPPGTPVRAPCAGSIAVAGRVGTSGGVVTVRCGPWRVSHMPLATITVRPGDAARRGAILGTLDESPAHAGLHLGVRRHGSRFGYVDPSRFFDATVLPPPLVPGVNRTRPPRLGPAPRPAPVRAPAAGTALVRPPAPPAFVPRPAPALVTGPRDVVAGGASGSSPPDEDGMAPWPAWAGLALALAGLGFGRRRPPRTPRAPRAAALPREVGS
jgi:hypothetical protein